MSGSVWNFYSRSWYVLAVRPEEFFLSKSWFFIQKKSSVANFSTSTLIPETPS
jgi:hypothetical protein